MAKCTQCGELADLRISWLARKSISEDEPQSCNICGCCMAMIWSRFSNTQFGHTLSIEEITK